MVAGPPEPTRAPPAPDKRPSRSAQVAPAPAAQVGAVLVSLPHEVAQVAQALAGGQPLDAWVSGLVLAARPPLSPAEKQRAYRARKAQHQ